MIKFLAGVVVGYVGGLVQDAKVRQSIKEKISEMETAKQ